jgi:hypothetical protein
VKPLLAEAAVRGFVAVASQEHVQRGQRGGFIQVCHGRAAPLRRLRPGDRVIYYSPTALFGGADKLQAFTGLCEVLPGEPYPFDMGGGFLPHRRDVRWLSRGLLPIRPLLGRLDFTAGPSWGMQLRRGLFEVSGHDLRLLAQGLLGEPVRAAAAVAAAAGA